MRPPENTLKRRMESLLVKGDGGIATVSRSRLGGLRCKPPKPSPQHLVSRMVSISFALRSRETTPRLSALPPFLRGNRTPGSDGCPLRISLSSHLTRNACSGFSQIQQPSTVLLLVSTCVGKIGKPYQAGQAAIVVRLTDHSAVGTHRRTPA